MMAISKSVRAAGRRGFVGFIGYHAGLGSGRPGESCRGRIRVGSKMGRYFGTVGFGEKRGSGRGRRDGPNFANPSFQPDGG